MFRRVDINALISAAKQAHADFEAEHIRYTEGLIQFKNNRATSEQFRTPRRLGEYDRDQRVERIVGEVTRGYYLLGKEAPSQLRRLVEEAV